MGDPAAEASAGQTEVHISVGPGESFFAALTPGEYTIGRDPDAEIWVDHPTISRRHARLVVGVGEVALSDLGSGNGTSIEGAPVSRTQHLYEGQTAVLGDVKLRVRQTVVPDELPEGSRNYLKGPQVARGGMGAVHEARQRVMGRKVAMKVMLQADSRSGLRRFINEARITGLLEHPNIVPVHELGVDGEGRVFYTMKFVSGTTLAEVLAALSMGSPEAVERYPLAALLTIFQKACDAIAFAHSRGVCHRDIKPDNLMIGDFGEVLVLDWGLAKERGFAGRDDGPSGPDDAGGETDYPPVGAGLRTLEGSVLGTPSYMPPEQARGQIGAVDERSDIYALGAVLHEILYLQPPVSGESSTEILQKVLSGQQDEMPRISRPHLPGGRVPKSLDAVRRKAMAEAPDLRYQTVQDLQADVSAYQTGFATSAEGAGMGTHALLFLKRNRGVSFAIVAALVLLTFASLIFAWDRTLATSAARRSEQMAKDSEQRAKDSEQSAQDARKEADQRAEDLAKALAQLEAEVAERERAQRNLADEQDARAREGRETETANARNAADFAGNARSMINKGNLEEAMKNILSAINLVPDNLTYLLMHAHLLQSSGRFEDSVAAYQKASEAGAGEVAVKNRQRSESFAARRNTDGTIPPDVIQELGQVLRGEERKDELPFLDALAAGASTNPAAGDDGEGTAELRSAIVDFTSQEGWNEGRLVVLQDGGVRLDLSGLHVAGLEQLRKINIHALNLANTKAQDLSALRDMPLEELVVGPETSDLSTLPMDLLRVLDLTGSKVADLAPLAKAPKLERLKIDGTPVKSLDALRGKPLKALSADVPGVRDFGVLSSLSELEELSLPRHATSVPVAELKKLGRVEHPRFQALGWINGERFKQLSAKSDAAWLKWRPDLYKLGGADLGPDRVTVVEELSVITPFPETFDLDLRGLEVHQLAPLQKIPANRVYLDTRSEPVSLRPLANHKWLQHLVLTDANVPSLDGVLANNGLKSIILSTETADVRSLGRPCSVLWAGYEFDESTRLPTTTREDLFKSPAGDVLPPHPKRSRRTEVAYVFDQFGMDDQREVNRWGRSPATANASGGLVWRPDPPKAGGLGGGYIEFFERQEDGQTSYFVAPKEVSLKRRKLYGSSLAFQLRTSSDHAAEGEVHVELRSGRGSLHYFFPARSPARDWRKYRVVLSEVEGWTTDSRDGTPATLEEVNNVLDGLDEILIRAEYSGGGGYERTSLDNFAIWDRDETSARAWEERRDEQSKLRWFSVESGPLEDWIKKLSLSGESDPARSRVWVMQYKGRQSPLLVRAISAEQPARITIGPEEPVEPGTHVRFAARGAPSGPGVNVRVMQGDQLLQEVPMGDRWTEVSVALPEGGPGGKETLCVLEVWPAGDMDPYCLISGLELVTPSNRN